MARLPTFGEVPGVPCDQCGETAAVVHLAEASLCDDCFEPIMAEQLEPTFGFFPCCTVVWSKGGQGAICLEPCGHGEHT